MEPYSPYNSKNIPLCAEDINSILRTHGLPNYSIQSPKLFQQAMVHSTYVKRTSYVALNGEPIELAKCPPGVLDLQQTSYEQLEFVGDSMLGCVVANYLQERFPDENPGFLTNTRKLLVRNRTLGMLARDNLRLDKYFLISKHVEDMKVDHGRQNIEKLGDVFEAFIAALWFDSNKNFDTVYRFIVTTIETYLDIPLLIREDDNFKDRMQKHCQQVLHYTPVYKIAPSSDEKACIFVMTVCSPTGEVLGTGTSNTKKNAEQLACKNALQKWGVI